jgi:hypothetical protein
LWFFEDNNVVKGFIEAEEYTLLYGDMGWNIIALAIDETAPDAALDDLLSPRLKHMQKIAALRSSA